MPFIAHMEDLRVGIDEFDVEHLQLGALSNLLYDAVRSDDVAAALDEVLDRLIHQTRQHFSHEEKIMLRWAYPGLAPHTDEHHRLTEAIKRFRAGTDLRHVDRIVLARRVADFMTGWLLDHIGGMDRELARFLVGQEGWNKSRRRIRS